MTNKTKTPRVSVTLNVFNGEKYVESAVKSVLAQTYTDFELIIVNDGSTDNTQEIIANIAQHDSRITIITQPNGGQSPAINSGIKQSSGEFFAHIDADDIWLDTKLQKQIEYFDANPDIGVLYTYYEILEQDGSHGGMLVPAPTSDFELRNVMAYYNPFLHSSLMCRMALLKQINGYDERFKVVIDYDLVVRLSAVTRLAILPEVLCYWRKSATQITAKKAKLQRWNGLKVSVRFARQNGKLLKILPRCARDLAVIITPKRLMNLLRRLSGRRRQ